MGDSDYGGIRVEVIMQYGCGNAEVRQFACLLSGLF